MGFCIEDAYKGKKITAKVEWLDYGVTIQLLGGEKTHIGSITVIDEMGMLHTTNLPGHKEFMITEHWAKELYKQVQQPICIVAGIHYDDLLEEEIWQVIQITKKLLFEIRKQQGCFMIPKGKE